MSTFPYTPRAQTGSYDSTKFNSDDMNYLLGTSTIYRAILNQSSTNAPIASVLENTTGLTFVYTRSAAGEYVVTPSVPINPLKGLCLLGSSQTTFDKCLFSIYNDGTVINLTVWRAASSDFADNRMKNVAIEIRIYP